MQYELVNTLDGAVEALTEGKADHFMWERFMTKPIVDAGIFRRIDDCLTPWPSFVIAVRNEVLEKNGDVIGKLLDIINQTTEDFKEIPSIDRMLSERYGQKIEDINEWLKLTRWSQQKLDKKTFEQVQDQLSELNIIEKKAAFEIAAG
jgi:ABC-type nitrate/sulfonate/bicarbonate transport system substrate-binding protein